MAVQPEQLRADALFQQALQQHQGGQLAAAESLYAEALALQPRHAGALHLSGVLAAARGALPQARDLLTHSVRVNPNIAQVHLDLGNVLHRSGKSEEALDSYTRAVGLQPDFLEAQFNKVLVLQQLQRFEEALQDCEALIAQQPNFLNALLTRAMLLSSLGRPEEALRAYDSCLQRAPEHGETLNNRGVLLLDMDRLGEALASFDAAIRLADRPTGVIGNRGVALSRLGRFEEAEQAFALAADLEPDNFEAHLHRANALRKLQKPESALESLDVALRIRPDSQDALLARADILAELSRYSDAAASIIHLTEAAPKKDYALGLRVYLQSVLCDWNGYDSSARQLVDAVKAGGRAAFPFNFLSVSDSAAAQLRCARTFAKDSYPAAAATLYKGEKYRHGKIRVAYLSGDYRDHPLSTLLAGVLEEHDSERFESLGISLRAMDDSAMGQRMRAAFDDFVVADTLSSTDIANLIRSREVDILVDLMGFTSGCRTEVLAMRPAPVQVNWLGHPGTMGASYIDYLMADAVVVPQKSFGDYAEKIVWMPECFQSNDRQRPMPQTPASRAEHGLPETGVVFCSFNNQYKLTPHLFEVWMRVLREVPDSVLWLFADESVAAENLRGEASRHGVASERLILAPRASYPEHMDRLRCADLALDTFPFNGGASTSDTLWAGIPVVTLRGEVFASRMAASLLNTVGIPELITSDIEAYTRVAIDLGRDPRALASVRARLEAARERSSLFDSARFCRHLERAYSFMRERAERGKRPASFSVAALEAPESDTAVIIS